MHFEFVTSLIREAEDVAVSRVRDYGDSLPPIPDVAQVIGVLPYSLQRLFIVVDDMDRALQGAQDPKSDHPDDVRQMLFDEAAFTAAYGIAVTSTYDVLGIDRKKRICICRGWRVAIL